MGATLAGCASGTELGSNGEGASTVGIHATAAVTHRVADRLSGRVAQPSKPSTTAPAASKTIIATPPGSGRVQHEVAAEPTSGDDDADRGRTAPGKLMGEFQLTYYWMAKEKQRSKRDVQLYTKRCKPLAKVSKAFAKRLAREGTGQLRDGRTINVSAPCRCKNRPCYFALSEDKRWGVGVAEKPLSPFRTVAVDPRAVPIGTILYVPELDGLTMPGSGSYGGFVHDGCVVADDRGGAVDGHHLDLFVAKKSYYQSFHRRHRLKRITVHDGSKRCKQDRGELQPVNRNSI